MSYIQMTIFSQGKINLESRHECVSINRFSINTNSQSFFYYRKYNYVGYNKVFTRVQRISGMQIPLFHGSEYTVEDKLGYMVR